MATTIGIRSTDPIVAAAAMLVSTRMETETSATIGRGVRGHFGRVQGWTSQFTVKLVRNNYLKKYMSVCRNSILILGYNVAVLRFKFFKIPSKI
jgi:hypothetical protein